MSERCDTGERPEKAQELIDLSDAHDPSGPTPKSAQRRAGGPSRDVYVVCPRCKSTMSGRSTCHCSVCHRNFGSVSGFDRHRRSGVCLDPATKGMVLSQRPGWSCWVFEISDEARSHIAELRAKRRSEGDSE